MCDPFLSGLRWFVYHARRYTSALLYRPQINEYYDDDDDADVQEWLTVDQLVTEFDEIVDEYLNDPSSISSPSVSDRDLSAASGVKTEL